MPEPLVDLFGECAISFVLLLGWLFQVFREDESGLSVAAIDKLLEHLPNQEILHISRPGGVVGVTMQLLELDIRGGITTGR